MSEEKVNNVYINMAGGLRFKDILTGNCRDCNDKF